jgi:hypothetical protein
MKRMLAALVAIAMCVPAAAVAQGARTNAPPGNSAIDEYLETVPGATGNAVPRPPVAGAGTLSAAQRARLEQHGADGRTLANIVESTSVVPRKQRPAKSEATPPDAKGRSPLTAALGVAEGDGDGGMGLLLPAILLASLLAVIALVLLRRRSAS